MIHLSYRADAARNERQARNEQMMKQKSNANRRPGRLPGGQSIR